MIFIVGAKYTGYLTRANTHIICKRYNHYFLFGVICAPLPLQVNCVYITSRACISFFTHEIHIKRVNNYIYSILRIYFLACIVGDKIIQLYQTYININKLFQITTCIIAHFLNSMHLHRFKWWFISFLFKILKPFIDLNPSYCKLGHIHVYIPNIINMNFEIAKNNNGTIFLYFGTCTLY